MAVELYFRTHLGQPWLSLWPGILGSVVVNGGVYLLLQGESLLGAFILFSLGTATARLVVNGGWLHEPTSPGVWAGYTLVLAAAILKLVWR